MSQCINPQPPPVVNLSNKTVLREGNANSFLVASHSAATERRSKEQKVVGARSLVIY